MVASTPPFFVWGLGMRDGRKFSCCGNHESSSILPHNGVYGLLLLMLGTIQCTLEVFVVFSCIVYDFGMITNAVPNNHCFIKPTINELALSWFLLPIAPPPSSLLLSQMSWRSFKSPASGGSRTSATFGGRRWGSDRNEMKTDTHSVRVLKYSSLRRQEKSPSPVLTNFEGKVHTAKVFMCY